MCLRPAVQDEAPLDPQRVEGRGQVCEAPAHLVRGEDPSPGGARDEGFATDALLGHEMAEGSAEEWLRQVAWCGLGLDDAGRGGCSGKRRRRLADDALEHLGAAQRTATPRHQPQRREHQAQQTPLFGRQLRRFSHTAFQKRDRVDGVSRPLLRRGSAAAGRRREEARKAQVRTSRQGELTRGAFVAAETAVGAIGAAAAKAQCQLVQEVVDALVGRGACGVSQQEQSAIHLSRGFQRDARLLQHRALQGGVGQRRRDTGEGEPRAIHHRVAQLAEGELRGLRRLHVQSEGVEEGRVLVPEGGVAPQSADPVNRREHRRLLENERRDNVEERQAVHLGRSEGAEQRRDVHRPEF
mmetsp:Transcript_6636/g.16451  ORF Transcript_6636/g.16451 Transcript_6636/m.16451 type:complete len:354 (-) Transcript_6636:1451-2512(-)